MSNTLVTALTNVLADTYALAVKTHAAHWNVTGAGFFELHGAFGEQYEQLFDAADELAERIRALGARAPAGLRSLTNLAALSDTTDTAGAALVAALRDDHKRLSSACKQAVEEAQRLGDEASADMLIGRIEAHDKTAWMLSAWAG